MRRLLVVAALCVLVSCCAQAFADGDQAFLAILAETKVNKIVGMKMPEMPPMPAGVDMSKMEAMMGMFSGKPQRVLNVRLWSPGIAPDSATATLFPPKGLMQGDKLNLDLYRPKPESGTTENKGKPGQFNPDAVDKFTIKIYWGSSATVRPGQPKIITWDTMPAADKEVAKRQAKESSGQSSYFYKPDWTTGYWPTTKQPGKIDPKASLTGKYSLETNYTGNVEIEAPDEVEFLDGFDLSSPDLEESPDLTKPIELVWKQIPNSIGLSAQIMGMQGKDALILWSSSEVFDNGLTADRGFMQMADVRALVDQTVFMKGDATKATVPIGIFKDCDTVNLTMAGYGHGAALAKAQPLPRIQTKSTLTCMLGGKMMKGMGGKHNKDSDGEEEIPPMPE
jgi:hypothetical protein